MRFQNFLLILVFIFFSSNPVFASSPTPLWNSALPVCEAIGKVDQENPQLVEDGAGGHIVVFEDKRSGYTRLYAQRIDEEGNLLWDKNGILLCSAKGNQTAASIIPAADNSTIIVWQDDRKGDFDIYAQKISLSGNLLWSPQGAAVIVEEKNQSFPQIIGDGRGGVYTCWQDLRGNGEDIYIQRLDSRGRPLWAEKGISLTSLPGTQWYPKIATGHEGGAVVVWSDRREGNFDLYAQRVGPAGDLKWEMNGIKIAGTSYSEEDPAIASLENGLIAIAYRIKNRGIYVKYFNVKGKFLSGKKLSSTLAPSAPQIAGGSSNDVVVIWSDTFAGDADIYGQRINEKGKLYWGNEEHPIIQLRGAQEKARIAGHGPWVIGWIDSRSGHPEIFAQKINSQGSPLWKEDGKRISKDQKDPENFDLLADNSGQAVFCFQDKRKGSFDIFGQKIKQMGETGWGYSGNLINGSWGRTAQKNVRLINDVSNNYIFAFEDFRSGISKIYLQKITSKGKKLWSSGGVPAASGSGKQENPEITSDGLGGAIVVWEDYRDPQGSKVFAQRISAKGKRSWNKKGVLLAKTVTYAEQTKPKVASDRKKGAIVVWEEYQGHFNAKDVYTQRINSMGKHLWGKKGKVIATGGGDQSSPQINPQTLVVTWTDDRVHKRYSDIYAQRLTLSGKILWEEDGIPVCEAPSLQRDSNIIINGKDLIISWTDKGGGSFDIYAQKIDLRGNPQWVKDGIAICQSSRSQQRARMALNGNGNITMVWEDFRFGNWNIFGQSFDSQGNLLFKDGGIEIVNLPGTQYDPQIIKIGKYNVIAWEDFRNEENYAIYVQKLDSGGKASYEENGVLIWASRLGGRLPRLAASRKYQSFIVVWEDFRFGEPVIYTQRFRP